MLVLRILVTVFIGMSIIPSLFKNIIISAESNVSIPSAILANIWSLLWRLFVIVAIWVV